MLCLLPIEIFHDDVAHRLLALLPVDIDVRLPLGGHRAQRTARGSTGSYQCSGLLVFGRTGRGGAASAWPTAGPEPG